MNAPSPLPPDPLEPFPFGTAFRAVCIVVFVVTFAVGVIRETRWGLDSEKIMVFGGIAIVLFFVSLWFSELRCGEILTEQHKGVSRWENPAKFRRVMIGQAIFLSILLAVMTIGTFKAFFGTKPEPHAESTEIAESNPHAESAEIAEFDPHVASVEGAESNPHGESAEITPVTPLVLMSSATVGDWTFAAWAGRCDEPLTFRLERKGEPLEWEPTQTGRQAWTTVNIEALRGALGHDGFLLSYETSATLPPCEWEYWIPDGDRLRLAARSFGRKDEGDGIWPVDLDGDGVNELVCNVSFVNGPHPQVHVFRNAGGTIEFCDNVRPVLLEPEGLPGPETWSRYDPATAKVRIRFLPREWLENPPDEGFADDLYETADCPLLPELLSWRPFTP